jgi:hypothetical protein
MRIVPQSACVSYSPFPMLPQRRVERTRAARGAADCERSGEAGRRRMLSGVRAALRGVAEGEAGIAFAVTTGGNTEPFL